MKRKLTWVNLNSTSKSIIGTNNFDTDLQGPPPLWSDYSDTVSLNGSVPLSAPQLSEDQPINAKEFPPLAMVRPRPAEEASSSHPPASDDHFLDMRSLANACREISLLDDKANRFAVLQDETCPIPQNKPKQVRK